MPKIEKNPIQFDWSQCEREDLYMISCMFRLDWMVEFDFADNLAKRTTPDNPPNHHTHFSKGTATNGKYCWWRTVDVKEPSWCVVDMLNGKFLNHRYYGTLDEVLTNE